MTESALEESYGVNHDLTRSREMKKDLDAKTINPGMKGTERDDNIGVAKIEQVTIRQLHGGQGAERELVAFDFSPFCIPLMEFLNGQHMILRISLTAVQENFDIHRQTFP
jgi:hypothetical protein